MTELIDDQIQVYAERFSADEPPILEEINTFTQANHPHAHMLSGRLQGRFLSMISSLLKPVQILEIGTFTGYSALCLAEGLAPGGSLHTIELRKEDAAAAQAYFNRSAYADQIRLHVGEAASIIPQLPFTWDLVFIDADKTGYVEYYELVLPRLRKGGLILADNVLFHGQVLEPVISGKNAKAIHAFNEHVKADNRVSTSLLTLRDGLLLIRKK
ncbi:class I SAM-dependent methyltransferase [Flavihumibacter sp. CACIAM 22H1]|uniref:O-methyltransferase n=1 Tax=Flavihumibacter sp. CACIAM 22H1 TaxID=1812911 RepID=UPI0007A83628|nr:class I SAM-dependent methyltransferase [Flavihumibacter sp. CACIAM 22H1]KYP16220.1 MAG: methyltransferase [Flavihumibacter sp. CACIAM 22H1]